MNTCDKCKFWVRGTDWADEPMVCGKFDEHGDGPKGDAGAEIFHEDCDAALVTGPKFGCVLWSDVVDGSVSVGLSSVDVPSASAEN